jgi:TorA maturation chaperone TorD
MSVIPETAPATIEEVDRARAREYSLLSTLLIRSPDAGLISDLARLQRGTSPLDVVHAQLSQAASQTDATRVAREYFELFVGVGRGELLPYSSFYQTGSLHGPPLASLRQTLREIGVEPVRELSEPEDHAAILCEIMSGLAGGEIVAPAGTDRDFFSRHLAPWIGRFFTDLEQAKAADFYGRVGAVGRTFIAIEAEGFTLPG